MYSAVELRILNTLGNEVFRISNDTLSGSILDINFNIDKIGGLKDFYFTINKEQYNLFYNGMIVEVYYKDMVFLGYKKLFSGYVDNIPIDDQSSIIKIQGKGFYYRLNDLIFTNDYTDATLSEIINDLTLSNANILGKDIGSIFETFTINFENKTYTQVLDTLLQILNEQYTDIQYVWYIDEYRLLHFEQLDLEIYKNLYEGYHFQNPSVDISDEIINSIDVYRAKLSDSGITEYVDTYEDSESINVNGIRKLKLTLSDYLATPNIEQLANSILDKRAYPEKTITIEGYYINDPDIESYSLIISEVDGDYTSVLNTTVVDEFYAVARDSIFENIKFERILPNGFYGINVKPQLKNFLISDCERISQWSQNIIQSVITDSADNFLTRDANKAEGEYIEYTLPNLVQNIIDCGVYIYFDTRPSNIKFSFYSIKGVALDIWLTVEDINIHDTWYRLYFKAPNNTVTGILEISDDGITDYEMEVSANGTDYESLEVAYPINIDGIQFAQYLRNIVKVRITLGESNGYAETIYIDRIDGQYKSWDYSKLTLEHSGYTIKNNCVLGKLDFGNKKSTLSDEINDRLAKGDLAFDMYAKG